MPSRSTTVLVGEPTVEVLVAADDGAGSDVGAGTVPTEPRPRVSDGAPDTVVDGARVRVVDVDGRWVVDVEEGRRRVQTRRRGAEVEQPRAVDAGSSDIGGGRQHTVDGLLGRQAAGAEDGERAGDVRRRHRRTGQQRARWSGYADKISSSFVPLPSPPGAAMPHWAVPTDEA